MSMTYLYIMLRSLEYCDLKFFNHLFLEILYVFYWC